ncbi:hypothetical protein [Zhongshania sp.]|uniref:hypothetical protein n=1 Tax=Zhongshania sp. TaxID=1971902 RepID=UPI003567C703
MITKLDGFPIYQIPEPIVQTATSDRFCYGRYWYNGHSKGGALYFGVAMGATRISGFWSARCGDEIGYGVLAQVHIGLDEPYCLAVCSYGA